VFLNGSIVVCTKAMPWGLLFRKYFATFIYIEGFKIMGKVEQYICLVING
jgi:hypothetical protein